MKDSFHCDEKTLFFDFVILMSDKTMKEIRFIRIIGRQKRFFKNGELGELNEWRCGVELRTPNGGGSFFETRMIMNKHEFFMN